MYLMLWGCFLVIVFNVEMWLNLHHKSFKIFLALWFVSFLIWLIGALRARRGLL